MTEWLLEGRSADRSHARRPRRSGPRRQRRAQLGPAGRTAARGPLEEIADCLARLRRNRDHLASSTSDNSATASCSRLNQSVVLIARRLDFESRVIEFEIDDIGRIRMPGLGHDLRPAAVCDEGKFTPEGGDVWSGTCRVSPRNSSMKPAMRTGMSMSGSASISSTAQLLGAERRPGSASMVAATKAGPYGSSLVPSSR